ncbi:MAG: hypothetical protein H6R25_4134 [Proteobacteria bacterium]|nr:hypothetical protein [Pseudomonadota bacterium]
MDEMTKLTVETALNAELTDHLGHEKNAPKSGSNTRNGYSSKTVLCDDGEIELSTPRDRENTFEPQLIKKNQTRITQMDSQILSLPTQVPVDALGAPPSAAVVPDVLTQRVHRQLFFQYTGKHF